MGQGAAHDDHGDFGVKPPSDRYYDVVGWPSVTFEAWECRPVWHLDQLDRDHRPRSPGMTQRYLEMERGGHRIFLDQQEEHEVRYRADNDSWLVKMPLWIADMIGVPPSWRATESVA